jgi:integrase
MFGHPRPDFHVPAHKQPQRLPAILSREDVGRLLNACPPTRHRLLLATTYAAGRRVGEVVALARAQRRALPAIETCRTAARGGHRDTCDTCGAVQLSHNSCRNRHCPKCQTLAPRSWRRCPIPRASWRSPTRRDVLTAVAPRGPTRSRPGSRASRLRRSLSAPHDPPRAEGHRAAALARRPVPRREDVSGARPPR